MGMTLPARDAELERIAADLAELFDDPAAALDSVTLSRSFSAFARAAWPIVEPRPLHWNWHLDGYSLHLEAAARKVIKALLMNVPPGTSKSTFVCVLFPAWVWTWWPSAKFIYWSYDQILSTRDSLKCRRLIQSKWYQDRWGHKVSLAPDQNLKTQFELTAGGSRMATTPAGHGTGEHPDFKVTDDVQSAKDASSAAERRSILQWRGGTLSTRGAAADIEAVEICVMQRLHEEDYTKILLDEGEWEHVCLPMRYEPGRMAPTSIGWTDPRKVPGELLDPLRFPEHIVAKLERRLGPYGAAGQLQQRPAPAEGGLFPKKAWRFWVPEGFCPGTVRTWKEHLGPVRDDLGNEYTVIAAPPEFDQTIQSWDMSFKGLKEALKKGALPDFVSGQVWARKWANVYLLDRVCRRMNIVETIEALVRMTADWPDAITKLVEDKANGPAIMQILERKVPGLTPVTPKGSKVARVMTAGGHARNVDARAISVQALHASGNLVVPHPLICPWVWDFIAAFTDFPNAAADDDVDAASQAITYLAPNAWVEEDDAHEEALRLGKPIESTQELFTQRIQQQISARMDREQRGGVLRRGRR